MHYGPGADSASNRNEYQEHFLGVKAAGELGLQLLPHVFDMWESQTIGTLPVVYYIFMTIR